MKFVVRGGEVEVTNLEFRLMYYLSFNRSRVFTRDELLDAVWGTQYASPRCVDACVRRLRRKIEPNLTKPTYLKTVRGGGILSVCLKIVSRLFCATTRNLFPNFRSSASVPLCSQHYPQRRCLYDSCRKQL